MSNSIPSTTVNSVSIPFASSTVIIPSWPTFSTAPAINFPISESLLAEIEATCSMTSPDFTGFEADFNSDTTVSIALSKPLFKFTGDIPAETFLRPYVVSDCAKTAAVDVPSPALSCALLATSLTNCAPIFS